MENWIDTFAVIALEGNVILPSDRVEITQRPGIDGTGAWKQGKFGDRFSLRSKVDSASVAAAHLTFANYLAKRGTTVSIIQDDVDYAATYSTIFLVLDVRPGDIGAMGPCSGGLNPPGLGWLEAEWDLVAIEITG